MGCETTCWGRGRVVSALTETTPHVSRAVHRDGIGTKLKPHGAYYKICGTGQEHFVCGVCAHNPHDSCVFAAWPMPPRSTPTLTLVHAVSNQQPVFVCVLLPQPRCYNRDWPALSISLQAIWFGSCENSGACMHQSPQGGSIHPGSHHPQYQST